MPAQVGSAPLTVADADLVTTYRTTEAARLQGVSCQETVHLALPFDIYFAQCANAATLIRAMHKIRTELESQVRQCPDLVMDTQRPESNFHHALVVRLDGTWSSRLPRCHDMLHSPTCIYYVLDFAGEQNLHQADSSSSSPGSSAS